MLIRNMGLFWKRADVFWGRPKNKGALKGIKRSAKRGDAIDFWEQSGVYALYANYRLVYVGQAGRGNKRLGSRLRKHTRDDLAGRWDTFSWFGLHDVTTGGVLSGTAVNRSAKANEILDIVEGILIAAAEPPLNRQGGRFGDGVDRYLQVRDARLDVAVTEPVTG